ncbi:MAG TPA: helix-turn-helix transcriptional regulator [Opitutus sp.]|nr:helix-turn-helix transcriptional regulator [Opitutus sp.]
MDYTQLFRTLREAKDLTLEELAALARVHRNTVVNIESGRPVKFKTIATLMRKMGYPQSSPEMKSMALLWLESVSGISFSRPETASAAKKNITAHRGAHRRAAEQLEEELTRSRLSAEQIELLVFAAQRREIMSILESIRGLVESGAPAQPLALKAAEEQEPYSGR